MKDKGQFIEGGVVTAMDDATFQAKRNRERELMDEGMSAHEAAAQALSEIGKSKLKTINPKAREGEKSG